METLELLPDQSGYGVDSQEQYYRTVAEGAAGFYSSGLEGYGIFSCIWILNKSDYILLNDFYKARKADLDSFKIKLISQSAFAEEHIAFFVENTYNLTEQKGDAYTVSCSLMAKPIKRYYTGTFKLTEDGKPKVAEVFDINKITEEYNG